ncbi:MAG: hypothetical protein ABW278_04545 [Steroidobacteraceae bacterium]
MNTARKRCEGLHATVAWLGAAALLAGPVAVMGQGAVPFPQTTPTKQARAPENLEELDEATVEATKLWQMREKMVALEERFYALYNDLNKDDDFDVHCAMEAPLGTRLKKRVCRIEYFENAQAEEAQALLGGYSAPPADLVLMSRYPDFTKTMLGLINGDPRLRKLVREREALEKRYIAERKKRFKGKWILFE